MTPNSHLHSRDIMNIKHIKRINNIICDKSDKGDKEVKEDLARNISFNVNTNEKSIKESNDKDKSCFPYINKTKNDGMKRRNDFGINRNNKRRENKRNKLNSLISEQYLNTVANFDLFRNWKKQVSKESKDDNNSNTKTNTNLNINTNIHLFKPNCFGIENIHYPKMISLSPISYQQYQNNYYQKKYTNSLIKTDGKNKQCLDQLKQNINYSNSLFSNKKDFSLNENRMRNEHSLCINMPYSNNTNNEASHNTNTNDEDSSSFINSKNLFKTFNNLDELSDEISNSTTHNTTNNNRGFKLPIAHTIQSTKPNLNSYSLVKLGEKRLKTDSGLFISDISKSFSSNKTEMFDIDKAEPIFSPCFARECPNLFGSSCIVIKVLSTWGNGKWFGVNSIKLFDKTNVPIEITKVKYGKQLILNSHSIKNESHQPNESSPMSLPIGQFVENDSTVNIYYSPFKEVKAISIRNYNRNDTSFGIKDIEIYRKQSLIWKGQVNQGDSNIHIDQVIQFASIELLSEVDENDSQQTKSNLKERLDISDSFIKTMNTFKTTQLRLKNIKRKELLPLPMLKPSALPLTKQKASSVSKHYLKFKKQNSMTNDRLNSDFFSSNILQVKNKYQTRKNTQIANGIRCKKLKMILSDNYGNKKHIGLTGIKLINNIKEVINIESAIAIGALPKDLSTFYGNNDQRIFENLFNGINETIDEGLMWLTMKDNSIIPFPFIEIAFGSYVNIAAIVFWNYNKEEELDKGVKQIELLFDDVPYNEHIILRKGIGEENANYGQMISFPFVTHNYSEEELEPFKTVKYASMLYDQQFETPYLPTGFVFKFVFVTNWGDRHLIGFNSLLLYDQLGRLIHLNKSHIRIVFFPNDKDSQSQFQSHCHSTRQNENTNPNLTYIAPFVNFATADAFNPNSSFSSFKPIKGNAIYVMFDRPVSMSYIKITNHAIKPERGVKQVVIYCDDRIIFNGDIAKYNYAFNKGESVVLFTCDMAITKNIKDNSLPNQKSNKQYHCSLKKESISLIND